MVLSGGYTDKTAKIISDSILRLGRKFGLFGKQIKKPDVESELYTSAAAKRKVSYTEVVDGPAFFSSSSEDDSKEQGVALTQISSKKKAPPLVDFAEENTEDEED
eukprot:TRINITY_DN4963_c0_g1_i2.p1 TRINITY_DN4963_c0_g1~~TRINITY_DN4963_c0_g1_i2.p1  ORF type:complete len:105 (-),score=30.01 TRINITY_DN4963_c0_g1_i2:31-345(-)